MDINEEIESILYICREVSVFRIPSLKANEGHRAQDWGDLAAPIWKGRLRITEKSSGVSILFEDSQNGELFAKANYDPSKPCVDNVLDSSRYFVIRVEDSGRKAYIGLGFAERTDSFDFNVALQDYTKRWRASLNPDASGPSEEKPSPHIPAGPKKDYSLKEGQTFSIAIPGRKKPQSDIPSSNLLGSTTASSATPGGAVPLLPPPPSSSKKRTGT